MQAVNIDDIDILYLYGWDKVDLTEEVEVEVHL